MYEIIQQIVARIFKRAGLKKKGKAHLLRHSFATKLINKGATLQQVGDVLRHQSTEIPPVDLIPRSNTHHIPHIYSDSEIIKLLESVKKNFCIEPIDRYSNFALFGLLAVTGMRPHEALNLKREDVDILNQIITIHESKFHKSRYIPIL